MRRFRSRRTSGPTFFEDEGAPLRRTGDGDASAIDTGIEGSISSHRRREFRVRGGRLGLVVEIPIGGGVSQPKGIRHRKGFHAGEGSAVPASCHGTSLTEVRAHRRRISMRIARRRRFRGRRVSGALDCNLALATPETGIVRGLNQSFLEGCAPSFTNDPLQPIGLTTPTTVMQRLRPVTVESPRVLRRLFSLRGLSNETRQTSFRRRSTFRLFRGRQRAIYL